jgi:Uma2 family endonuclease
MAAKPDEAPELYLLCGRQYSRPMPSWHWQIQRTAMVVAQHLDEWLTKQPEPAYEIFSNAGFLLRDYPPTAIRISLAVVRGRFPTLQSDWVPAKPLVAVEIHVGDDRYGDLEDRVDEYLACGVTVVWLITPSFKMLTIHRAGSFPVALDARGTLAGDPELPGFTCPVADLFR